MSGNSEDFKFNLDVRDATASIETVRNSITALGDSKNLSGLIQSFTRLAGPIALAGTALLAFKAAVDMSVAGESIIRIEENFKNFSNQVGVSSEEMIKGIEKSTHGMVDLEDAMSSANKVMIDFGEGAEKIPELFDIATKASLVYGGSVTENFEKISMAITGGNTRMLKSVGLKVDAASAESKYALALGKTVDTLTEQEKRQATLNAVLAKGKESFKSVDESVTPVTVSLKKLGITIHDIGEEITKNVAQTWGGPFAKVFDLINKGLKNFVPKAPIEEAKERVESLKNKIQEAQEVLAKRAEAKGFVESVKAFWSTAGPMTEKIKLDLAVYNQEIVKAEDNLAKLQKKQGEDVSQKAKKPEKSQEEIAAEKAQYSQFQKDLISIKQQRLQSEMNIETDASKYKQQLNDQIVLFEEQTQNKISQISANAGMGKTYTHAQAAQIIEQIEADKTAKIKALQDDLENNQMKVFDNQLRNAKTAADGMATAFAQGAAQAKKESKDFGAQGVQTFNSVKNNAVSAFKAMGDGSKSAGDAIKGFLLNSVADYVEMKGQAMLLEGMWPPNPLAIAAGGGLIALSAAMRSAAGGGGGGSSSGGAVAGGGASAGPTSAPAPVEQQKKSVTVQVQGNYFETEQTKTRLLEMMREASDATDFKYQQIGVS